jgi:hypothetical protein
MMIVFIWLMMVFITFSGCWLTYPSEKKSLGLIVDIVWSIVTYYSWLVVLT